MSSVEPGLGIIIGSAAATRPLFRILFSEYHPFVSLTHPTPGRTGNCKDTQSSWPRSMPAKLHDVKIGPPVPLKNLVDTSNGEVTGLIRN
jgi:hypothetical protein